nr:hp [Calliteara abietis nucleopolyhedrovirus]
MYRIDQSRVRDNQYKNYSLPNASANNYNMARILSDHSKIKSDVHKLRAQVHELCQQSSGVDADLCSRIANSLDKINNTAAVGGAADVVEYQYATYATTAGDNRHNKTADYGGGVVKGAIATTPTTLLY